MDDAEIILLIMLVVLGGADDVVACVEMVEFENNTLVAIDGGCDEVAIPRAEAACVLLELELA